MRLYLSGPMSGVPEFNFPAFMEAGAVLREDGHDVWSPAEMDLVDGVEPDPDGRVDDPQQYAKFLQRDLRLIVDERIEAIVVLPGFERSKGARAEVALGQAIGLDILAYPGLKPVATATADTAEVRIKNDATGGEKGRKPQRFELLPWGELGDVAELYGEGANKYEDNNWRRGYDWSLSMGALSRHLGQFWEGEDYDAETGCHHLTSVVFHALALLHFVKHFPDLDDRPNTALDRARREADEPEAGVNVPRHWV